MYYLGIDLGGTNIAIGIVDENYNLILKEKVPTKKQRETSEIIDDMANLCTRLVERANLTFDDIAYVGIATPGSVDPETGVVRYSNNVRMENYPIADELKKRIPLKEVYIENDANAAALAEAKVGAGRGCSDIIMITLGTGVGGGIVIGGKLYSGFNYSGGELGHIVIEHNGRPCTCGRKGCWEQYASATALIREATAAAKSNPDSILSKLYEGNFEEMTGELIFEALDSDCPVAKDVFDKVDDDEYIFLMNLIEWKEESIYLMS